MNNKTSLILGAVTILAIGVVAGFVISNQTHDQNSGTSTNNQTNSPATNLPAPEDSLMDGWETITDTTAGISFDYPRGLDATYIDPVDWPPHAQVNAGPLTCTQAGNETVQGGQTQQQIINNKTYCVTKVSEGAAGSTYTQYAYAFAKDSKVVILTFSLRYPQCGNYNDPEKTVCDTERQSFNLDNLIDRIAQTVVLSS